MMQDEKDRVFEYTGMPRGYGQRRQRSQRNIQAQIAPSLPAVDDQSRRYAPSVSQQQSQPSQQQASRVQAQIMQGFTPLQAMEGFDWNREQNTGKSAKDAFAYLANEAAKKGVYAPLNSADKNAYGQWFNDHIRQGMNDLGHEVMSVDGDKFRFKNWQGTYDVDFGRGAGAQGGALAWQASDPNQSPFPANNIYSAALQQFQPQQQQPSSMMMLLQRLLAGGQ